MERNENGDVTDTYYLVEWEGIGYYAKHQGQYNWSFTHDKRKANRYVKRTGAEERGQWGQDLQQHSNTPYVSASGLPFRVVEITETISVRSAPGKWVTEVERKAEEEAKAKRDAQTDFTDPLLDKYTKTLTCSMEQHMDDIARGVNGPGGINGLGSNQ